MLTCSVTNCSGKILHRLALAPSRLRGRHFLYLLVSADPPQLGLPIAYAQCGHICVILEEPADTHFLSCICGNVDKYRLIPYTIHLSSAQREVYLSTGMKTVAISGKRHPFWYQYP